MAIEVFCGVVRSGACHSKRASVYATRPREQGRKRYLCDRCYFEVIKVLQAIQDAQKRELRMPDGKRSLDDAL